MRRIFLAASVLASTFIHVVNAAPAHEHGVANLDVAVDGDTVAFSLRGAAEGFVGFEHAPSLPEERVTWTQAQALLSSGELFVLDAAAHCLLAPASMQLEFASGEMRETAGEVAKPHHDEAQHDQSHHDADGHHEDEHADAHADWSANWQVECADPLKLRSLRVDVFQHFANLREMRVQLITPTQQTAADLSPQSNTVALVPDQ